MSRVFASETLRFYNCNSRYKDFLHDCLRLCTDFLDKGYPPHLLLDGLLKIWRKESHTFAKYGNTLKDLHRDLLRLLPARFDLANRPTATYHDSTMRIAQITPTGTTPLSLPTNTFIAASTPSPSQHDTGFFHWYQHHRKRRKLAALGQHARMELTNAAAHDRYSAIRQRQLATGLPPQHHLKPRDRHGPAKFHHRAVKK